MSKSKGTKNSKSKPKIKIIRKIKSEINFSLTDAGKIMLEIVCEKLIEDLSKLLTKMEALKNSSSLYTHERKKDLLKSLIFSKKLKDYQIKQIKYQIVGAFLFVLNHKLITFNLFKKLLF